MYYVETIGLVNGDIRVKVIEDNKVLYREDMDVHEYSMYSSYIKKRLKLLLDDSYKLSNDYVMFECGDRMYALADLDYCDNHRKLKRQVIPLGYTVEDSRTFDILLDSTLYDMFTYPKDALVYKFDRFYLNGKELYSIDDIEASDPSRHLVGSVRDIDFDYAYGKDFDAFIKFVEHKEGVKLKEFHSTNAQCYFD